jgi:hypothetical protein
MMVGQLLMAYERSRNSPTLYSQCIMKPCYAKKVLVSRQMLPCLKKWDAIPEEIFVVAGCQEVSKKRCRNLRYGNTGGPAIDRGTQECAEKAHQDSVLSENHKDEHSGRDSGAAEMQTKA